MVNGAMGVVELASLYLNYKYMKPDSKLNNKALCEMAKKLLLHGDFLGQTVWLVGNGGSSATMSHLCSDLLNLGFNAVCLSDNIPSLTAKTNDDGWSNVYVKLVEDRLKADDVVFIASVHGGAGKSPVGESWSDNLLYFAEYASACGALVFSMSGCKGGRLKEFSHFCASIDCDDPYVVEGVHSVWCHALVAELVKLMENEENE